jgi:hypothetical protein
LDYADKLHDSYSDYPLAPEPLIAKAEMFRAKRQEQQEAHNIEKTATAFCKLIANLSVSTRTPITI